MTHRLRRERGALNAAQISYPGIFWESQSCLITTYSAGTAVGVISCICVSYFCYVPSSVQFPPPLFFFLQVANINSGKNKTHLRASQPKYLSCNSRQKHGLTSEPGQPRSSWVIPTDRMALLGNDKPCGLVVDYQENGQAILLLSPRTL